MNLRLFIFIVLYFLIKNIKVEEITEVNLLILICLLLIF